MEKAIEIIILPPVDCFKHYPAHFGFIEVLVDGEMTMFYIGKIVNSKKELLTLLKVLYDEHTKGSS